MKFVIFDTETTGLPRDFSASAFKGPNNWPHIVSISWAVMSDKFDKILSSQSYMIKPQGWDIPFESTAIHGIMTSDAIEYGHNLGEVMDKFFSEECDGYIAHNMIFDKNVVYNAMLWDLGYEYFRGFGKPKICTMAIGRSLCKLPKNKQPKLFELYNWATKKDVDKSRLHNSMFDTLTLCDCISGCDEIRIRLLNGYKLQINESQTAVATVIQETTSKAVDYQGSVDFVV
jgi:DNA polymerase-3 subunit alpha